MKRLCTASPLVIAEARLAAAFLGESTAAELYGRATVDVALRAREGAPTGKLIAALYGGRS